MIPRYQTVLFVVLLVASIIMGVVLWQVLDRAHQRLLSGQNLTPTAAPEVAPAERATLLVASDADNTLLAQAESLPLPKDPGGRARMVLGKLLDLYAAPSAAHPVPGGAAGVAQVFLLPDLSAPKINAGACEDADADCNPKPAKPAHLAAPSSKPGEPERVTVPYVDLAAPTPVPAEGPEDKRPLLAVVNLTAAFASSHPSGLETESLTVLSICATLHANLPRVAEVRFLVDGQPKATLAGHADLTRSYLAEEAVPSEGVHP